MAFCRSCGNDVTGVKFCGKCGTPVEEQISSPIVPGQPVVNNGSNLPKDNAGLWGFILGLLGVTACCGITSIPALICSIVSMNNVKKGLVDSSNQWMGVAGLVLGILGTLLIVFYVIYFVFVLMLSMA